MSKIYIFYHGGCADGFASAYAAWKYFGDEAEYVPCYFGYPPPDLPPNQHIYFLDFSYSSEEMEKLRSEARTFYVVDHHKTNNWLDGKDYANFDLNHSGAYLSYQEFVSENVPYLIRYVEDRDLWNWKLPYAKEVTSAMSSYRVDFEEYDHMVNKFEAQMNRDFFYYGEDVEPVLHTDLYTEGKAIVRAEKIMVDEICDTAQVGTFWESEWKAWDNIPHVCAQVLHSDIGHELLHRYPNAPFAVTWRDNADNIRSYSLRSMDDREDISVICKALGGGGHRNAGGFEVDLNKPNRKLFT